MGVAFDDEFVAGGLQPVEGGVGQVYKSATPPGGALPRRQALDLGECELGGGQLL